MTTTRINHTGHAHANTTAARTACRKAASVKIETYAICAVGNGKQTHIAVLGHDGTLIGAKCGAGLQRGVRKASSVRRLADLPIGSVVGCHRCR